MVSPEFKSTVSNGNLLRTRIMLKDSFVLDPTFHQFNEMLIFAKAKLPTLMEEYDGEYLEVNPEQWTYEVMNEELVSLVTNFSMVRIEHLKKVVSKVLAKEAELIRNERDSKSIQNVSPSYSDFKKEKRQEALRKMRINAKRISQISNDVELNKRWDMSNIKNLEIAAKNILDAVSEYKMNS